VLLAEEVGRVDAFITCDASLASRRLRMSAPDPDAIAATRVISTPLDAFEHPHDAPRLVAAVHRDR